MVLDLASTSVFFDFDGAVLVGDARRHVLERLGDPAWKAIEADYEAGLVGQRELLRLQWPLIRGGLEAARPVAREVAVDPGMVPLLEVLRARGAEISVVSDDFGFYASEVCAELDAPLITNTVNDEHEVEFPWVDRCCPCSTCGVCKQALIKDARRKGRTAVLIADRVTDYKAALLADVLFAKNALADWCDDAAVDYRPFARLDDVRRALVG